MSNNAEYVKRWRVKTKKRMINSFGGKCGICGYNKCIYALDFHHLDPNEKEFGMGEIIGKPISWDKISNELRKCICVCSNCHREIHSGITKIPDNVKRFDEKYNKEYKNKREIFSTRKVKNRPSKEQLLKEVKMLGYCGTGRKYGVSDNTIRRWLK